MKYDLSEILSWLGIHSENLGVDIYGMSVDSRKVKPGDLFVALNGTQFHGIDFAYQVQRTGAKAILAESYVKSMAKPKSRREPLKIPVVEIENLGQKLGHIASKFYLEPSKKLKITGITGTNGKTSCAWLLAQSWEKLGINSGYIGTLGYGTPSQLKALKNTTPSALDLQQIYFQFVNEGITHVAMEVSSHGLHQGRCNATEFQGAAYTNLSQDHLDYHHTLDNYAACKELLFSDFKSQFQIINANDNYGKSWLLRHRGACSYAINNSDADFQAKNIILTPEGIEFDFIGNDQSGHIESELLGQFNIENLLLVISTLIQQGFDVHQIKRVVKELKPVMGRMNRITTSATQPIVVIDYAHTPDALEQVLTALKRHNPQKLWCVFGCGGNRDKGKRPQMGHIAESLSDHVIITDDNPRFESSESIMNDIMLGMIKDPRVIANRAEAIRYAIENADPNDIVLIAGKGHENYQEIQGSLFPFDDKNTALQILGECA